jgi:hypothetical protein
MQLPFATRHAFSDNHPATYEAVLVLVLAKAGLRRTGAKRDNGQGERCRQCDYEASHIGPRPGTSVQ